MILLLALLLGALLTTWPADAGTAAGAAPVSEGPPPPAIIELANGDRLSGTVLSLADGTLVLSTSWAGEIAVDWSRVASLVSTEPLIVVLADGTRLTGTATSPAAGRLEVRAVADTEGRVAFPLSDVAAVNPPAEAPVRFRGHVAVAVTSSSGNTDSRRGYGEGELVARTEGHRFTLGGQADEAREDGRTSASSVYVWLGYDHLRDGPWYFNSNASFRQDELQDLKLRSTLGLAAGYQLADDERFRLGAELGASYVNDDFQGAPDDEYPAARWSLDLARQLAAADGLELFHFHEVLQSLEGADDRLLRTRTGLRFHLWRNLVASLQLNYNRDESPAPGREKDDVTWLLNLGYDW